MNKIPFYTQMEHLQPKLHGLAVGMTLGMGSIFLNQGCPLLGQCPTCMACAPSVSLLALPLLADGAIFLSTKVLKRKAEEAKYLNLGQNSGNELAKKRGDEPNYG